MAEVVAKMITPITSMILARLLAPEAFGVVASINVVFSFCDIFSDAGFQKYIIQHKTNDEGEIDRIATVAFWSNLAVSMVIWLFVVLFADRIASFVGCEGKGLAVAVACASLPLTAFSSVQGALLKRNLNFKPLFYVRRATVVVPVVVTVPLALITKSYWALIAGTISVNGVIVVAMSVLLKWRPKRWFSFKTLRGILDFSVWTLLESLLVWFINWGDVFIVANILSSYYLGLYNTSMNMVNQAVAVVSSSTVPVLLSALSRLQEDDEEFKRVYYKFVSAAGAVLIPMGVAMWVFREVICEILLGSAWGEAATLMGTWGLISALSVMFNSFNGNVLIAKGKPNLSVVIQVIQIIFIVPTVFFSAKLGFSVLSYSRALVRIVGMIVYSLAVWKIAKISFSGSLRALFPYIVGALVAGLTGWLALLNLDGIVAQIASLVACGVVYVLVLLAFRNSREMLIRLLRGKSLRLGAKNHQQS